MKKFFFLIILICLSCNNEDVGGFHHKKDIDLNGKDAMTLKNPPKKVIYLTDSILKIKSNFNLSDRQIEVTYPLIIEFINGEQVEYYDTLNYVVYATSKKSREMWMLTISNKFVVNDFEKIRE